MTLLKKSHECTCWEQNKTWVCPAWLFPAGSTAPQRYQGTDHVSHRPDTHHAHSDKRGPQKGAGCNASLTFHGVLEAWVQ